MLLGLYIKSKVYFDDLRVRAQEERGASAVEYGLLIALIAAIIVLVVQSIGTKVSQGFQDVDNALP